MTDKEKIKEEILRRKQSWQHSDKQYEHGGKDVCDYLLGFIDSLPEEPASDYLDFLVISLEETIGTSPHSREVIKEHLQKAAEWGRNHIEDKSEMVSEDLDIAATSIIKRLGGMEKDDCVSEHELKIFKAAIDWQKKKDQEVIELAEDHAMLAGMNRVKEEMMKDAVELHIVESFNPVGTENEKPHIFTALCYNAEYPDFYSVAGQTIKVIPIKEI